MKPLYFVLGSVLYERDERGRWWGKCCGCFAIMTYDNQAEMEFWVEYHKDHTMAQPLPPPGA